MLEDTIYFGTFKKGELVGISSCEMNKNKENVEMKDFPILPKDYLFNDDD